MTAKATEVQSQEADRFLIADFTSTTEKLESEELTQLLNRYLTEMARIASEFGGTIDKYIGDAVLGFFGDPESKGCQARRLRLRAHGDRDAATHARAAVGVAGARC